MNLFDEDKMKADICKIQQINAKYARILQKPKN